MVTIEHCTWEYSARDLFLFGEGTLSPSFMAVPIYMHTHTPKDMCVYICTYELHMIFVHIYIYTYSWSVPLFGIFWAYYNATR